MATLIPSLDRKLLRDLWRMKGQVLAIAAVLAGGVSLFVLMLGTLQSLTETRDAYYDRYRFAHVFAETRRAPEGLMAEIQAIPGVQAAESRILVDVVLDIPEMMEPASGRLISLPDGGNAVLNSLALVSGRLPEPADALEVAVSQAFAEAHGLGPGDRVAAILNQRYRELTISGVALSPEFVYSLAPGALFPDDRTFGVFWVPRSALAGAFDLDGAFNSVSALLLRGTASAPVIAEIDRLLDPYGGLGAYDRSDQISDWFLENELEQLTIIIRIMPPIFLLVAAFLLNVAIARLIETEREQIGLLKAFGYSDIEVAWHYAKLALGIALVGVALGCALGAWMGRGLTELYAEFFRFPFLYYQPELSTYALAAAIGVAAALGGTWTAVRRAARLPPAEAMRPPAPARFHRSALDRSAVTAWMTQTGRIILRNIRRWPGRSALTMLGTGVAVALMIASSFMLGSIEHIMDIQFGKAQRQDATVTFVEPRGDAALAELRRLPGVIDAEPFHSVPVRLRAGTRVERTGLLGLEPEPRIFTLLDTELDSIPIPPTGLLMAVSVAERLGVGRGDSVEIEVMTGRRPTLTVTVTALAEEYIGGSVAMDRRELARLLGEPEQMAGAHLVLDARELPAFHHRIKETPVIAGVAMKSRMLESFREHVAENTTRIVLINVLFAGMIAFGVVYNSARIMLSERARELASLRVLGFTRFEIGYILLGELALLTAVAMPLGCLMGYGLAAFMAAAFDTELYRIPLIILPSVYGLSIAVVGTAAMLSAAVIGWRLRSLDLVAVLKARD